MKTEHPSTQRKECQQQKCNLYGRGIKHENERNGNGQAQWGKI